MNEFCVAVKDFLNSKAEFFVSLRLLLDEQ